MDDEAAALPLGERDVPWFARIRLGRARKRHQTGLLLSAIIRTGSPRDYFQAACRVHLRGRPAALHVQSELEIP